MESPQIFIPFTPSPGGIKSPKMSDPKERFFRHFQAEVTIIQDQIEDLSTLSAINGERKDCTDTILAGISRLNNEVIDAGDYIPAYDQRAYSQAIKGLTEKLNETTGKFKPKSRFQFKPRTQRLAGTTTQQQPAVVDSRSYKPGSTTPREQNSPETAAITATAAGTDSQQQEQTPSKDYNAELQADASPARVTRRPSFSQAKIISLRGHTGLRIAIPAESASSTSTSATSTSSPCSASLTDLDRCVVDLTARTAAAAQPLAGLVLKNIRRSVVAAGRVGGAAHVTGLSDAVVAVAARQVRIHECRNVDVYLRCASHPIIEDCEGMRFAPLPGAYELPEEPEQRQGPNQWDQVDDFKWLRSEPSPNWSVLPEDGRIPEAVWSGVLGGDEGASADEILRKVGVLGA